MPTELPEGSVVELAIVLDEATEDPQLIEELAAAAQEEAAGDLVDFDPVVRRLGTPAARPRR